MVKQHAILMSQFWFSDKSIWELCFCCTLYPSLHLFCICIKSSCEFLHRTLHHLRYLCKRFSYMYIFCRNNLRLNCFCFINLILWNRCFHKFNPSALIHWCSCNYHDSFILTIGCCEHQCVCLDWLY